MWSNPCTQPLYLVKVKADRWQTQLNHQGPRSLCIPLAVLFCCLHTWLHTNAWALSEEQTTDRSRTCWCLRTEIHSKTGKRHSPGSGKLRKLRGIWDVILSQHSVWASLAINSVPLLPSAPDLCWSRHILLVAPQGLRMPINLWGRREAVLKRPRQTVAVNFTLEDSSEGRLQL